MKTNYTENTGIRGYKHYRVQLCHVHVKVGQKRKEKTDEQS